MTITDNILRVLRSYGLDDSIAIKRAEVDRIFARPVGGRLTDLITDGLESGEWNRTSTWVANRLHGGGVVASYREQATPSLQVTVHLDGILELDLDQHDPEMDLVNLVGHGAECAENRRSHTKTDQDDMSRRLDQRFGDPSK